MRRVKKRKMKPPIPTRAIDMLIGDEEEKGNQKKQTGSRPPTQLLWTIWSPLMTHMDHMMGLL